MNILEQIVSLSCLFQCVVHSWNDVILSICRKRLFSLINDLPTLFDVVTGRKPIKDNKPSSDSGSKSRNGTKVHINGVFFLVICFVDFPVSLLENLKRNWFAEISRRADKELNTETYGRELWRGGRRRRAWRHPLWKLRR